MNSFSAHDCICSTGGTSGCDPQQCVTGLVERKRMYTLSGNRMPVDYNLIETRSTREDPNSWVVLAIQRATVRPMQFRRTTSTFGGKGGEVETRDPSPMYYFLAAILSILAPLLWFGGCTITGSILRTTLKAPPAPSSPSESLGLTPATPAHFNLSNCSHAACSVRVDIRKHRVAWPTTELDSYSRKGRKWANNPGKDNQLKALKHERSFERHNSTIELHAAAVVARNM